MKLNEFTVKPADWEAWDKQIEGDIKNGALDELLEELDDELDEGELESL